MAYINDLIRSVKQERLVLGNTSKEKWVTIEHFERSKEKHGIYYELWLSEGLHLQENMIIELVSPKHRIQATVVRLQDNQNPVVITKETLKSKYIYRISAQFDPSFILSALADALESIDLEKSPLLKDFLDAKLPTEPAYPFEYHPENTQLNESQQRALTKAMSYPTSLIWGPPGTGKTKTLAETLIELLKKKLSVLVVSTSNVAIDQVLTASVGLSDAHLFHKDFYRLGITDHPIANQYLLKENQPLPSGRRAVFSTIATLALKYPEFAQGFNTVIIDEASMVSLPNVAIAAALAKRRLIIAGDFRQLPPISLSESPNMLRHAFDTYKIPQAIEQNKNLPALTMLDTQYRMSSGISDLISHTFYHGMLKCGVKRAATAQEKVFIDMQNSDQCAAYYSVDDKSYYHPLSPFVLDTYLQEAKAQDKGLLYLTPFRAQQTFMNNHLLDQSISLGRALTIHKSQGSEMDWVIVDFTLHAKTSKNKFSPLFETAVADQLLNVAMSRAKEKLIILANQNMLNELCEFNPMYKGLIKTIQSQFTQVSANQLLYNMSSSDLSQLPQESNSCLVIDNPARAQFLQYIRNQKCDNKVYVSQPSLIGAQQGDFQGITFLQTDKPVDTLPEMAYTAPQLWLQTRDKLLMKESKIGGKTLMRLAIGHWLDLDEAERSDTFVLSCHYCSGNKTPKRRNGVFKLICGSCNKGEHLSMPKAEMLQKIYKVTCPVCKSKTKPRKSPGQSFPSFYGCSNYPHCKGSIPFDKAFFL